jgi:hypothetical protein
VLEQAEEKFVHWYAVDDVVLAQEAFLGKTELL